LPEQVAVIAATLNPTTAGFVLLVAVMFIASRFPLRIATTSAVLAALLYNYFFFPPTGTLRIADPGDWITLGAFLITALLANRLLVRERLQSERRGEPE
jgi:two-component system sensor histidine kinase KdpD